MLRKEILQNMYPEANPKQVASAIKYQTKFYLTYENLNCLNPDCQNMKRWKNTNDGFYNCCSKECTKICMCTIHKAARVKASESYFERTGYTHQSKDPKIKLKKKDTTLKNFGTTHHWSSPVIKDQIKKTNLVKYGVDNPSKSQDVIQKIINTNLTKYGFNSPLQNVKIRNKRDQTCLVKFGVKNIFNDKLVQANIRKTIYNKYGVKNFNQKHLKNLDKFIDVDFITSTFINENNNFELYKFMDFFNCSEPLAHQQMVKLNIPYTKLGGTSLKEQDITNRLRQNYKLEVISNSKKIIFPQEVDIWLPELNLAIEYNGAYWHSTEAGKDLLYHQTKSLRCLKKGIRLLHIYEHHQEEQLWDRLDKFLINAYELDATIFDLDDGCFPINGNFEILEPLPFVCKKFQLYNAGQIKISGSQS